MKEVILVILLLHTVADLISSLTPVCQDQISHTNSVFIDEIYTSLKLPQEQVANTCRRSLVSHTRTCLCILERMDQQ